MRERLKKDKKLRRNLILAFAALIILIGASVYTLFIKPNLSTETYVYKEETVERGDLILGIMESGSLSFGESYVMYELDLNLDEESEDEDDDEDEEDEEETAKYLEIEEVYVVSGQRISQGDVLFKLDDDSVSDVRRKLNSALTEAKIALSDAQTEYNISMLSAKSTYDRSMAAGNRATADYQAALTASSEKVKSLEAQIQVLQLEITIAQEKLADEDLLESYNDAKLTYTQAKESYEKTDLHNATAYTSNLLDFQQAESQLEKLEEELQGYRDTIEDNTARIEELQTEIADAKVNQVLENQQAQNDYNAASTEGKLAQEIYDYSVNSLSESVEQAQAELDEMQAKMEAFEAFVGEDNQIYATESGLVSNVAYEAGDDLVRAGAMLTYAKEDEYTVSIDISEEDIAAVAVGDSVELAFSAYPDKVWNGEIISITTTSTSEHATTISYPVTIHVQGDTTLLYDGMTADVTFVIDSVTDVLYVSRKAVFEEDGVSYVYRKNESGNREKTKVETGFSDTSSVEIVSGLEEGDIVYIESIMNVSTENQSAEKESSEKDSVDKESTNLPEMPENGFEGEDPFRGNNGRNFTPPGGEP